MKGTATGEGTGNRRGDRKEVRGSERGEGIGDRGGGVRYRIFNINATEAFFYDRLFGETVINTFFRTGILFPMVMPEKNRKKTPYGGAGSAGADFFGDRRVAGQRVDTGE